MLRGLRHVHREKAVVWPPANFAFRHLYRIFIFFERSNVEGLTVEIHAFEIAPSEGSLIADVIKP